MTQRKMAGSASRTRARSKPQPPEIDHVAMQHLDELIDDFDNAMLVTLSPGGEMRSRPLALACHEKGGQIYFVTSCESAKVDEIVQHPQVNVVFQSGHKFLSISGTAELIRERAMIDSMWKPAWKVWFPLGKDDPSLTLLKIDPTVGEFWDRSGARGLQYLFKAGAALMRGTTPEFEGGEKHAKLVLHRS